MNQLQRLIRFDRLELSKKELTQLFLLELQTEPNEYKARMNIVHRFKRNIEVGVSPTTNYVSPTASIYEPSAQKLGITVAEYLSDHEKWLAVLECMETN